MCPADTSNIDFLKRESYMEPISLNHTQILRSSQVIKSTEEVVIETPTSSALATSPAVQVILSPAVADLGTDHVFNTRFASAAEYDEHMSKLREQYTSASDYENGTRPPFASAEDERLSHLTMKELLAEAAKLPRIDENGHLLTSIYGNAAGDRYNTAMANLSSKAYFDYNKSAKKAEESTSEFKSAIQDKFKIDSNSYDIISRDGKITAVGKLSSSGKAASADDLAKIQSILNNPSEIPAAKNLIADIEQFNQAAWQLMDNAIVPLVYGPTKNPYLVKSVSEEWVAEGINYSKATNITGLNDKYLSLIADARAKYTEAVKDGTHLSNYDIDPGILELTRMREAINVKA